MTRTLLTHVASTIRRFVSEHALSILTIGYWLIWCLGSTPYMCQPDCVGYYAYLQSLVVDHDLAVANEFAQWQLSSAFTNVTALGQMNNVFACGSALLWLPFVAATHGILLLAQACGADVDPNGHTEPYLQAVAFASSWYGYLAIVLSYLAARRITSSATALWATVSVGTLTSVWHYMFFDGVLSHALSAFADALFVYLALPLLGRREETAVKRPRWSWAVLGLAGGLAGLVRWQEVVLPALVGVLLLAELGRWIASRYSFMKISGPRWESAPLSAAMYFLAGFLTGFLPQLVIWNLQQGTLLALPQGSGFLRPLQPQIAYVLASSHHGLFTWTPLVLFSVLGFATLVRHEPKLATFAAVTFFIQVYVNSIVLDPAAGISFGARRFTGLTILYVMGLAALLARAPRSVGLGVTCLSAIWTLPLWLAFHFKLIDQARYVSFEELYSAALQALIRLPQLAQWLKPRFLEQVGTVSSWTPFPYALSASGILLAVRTAKWIAYSENRRSRRRVHVLCAFAAIFANVVVVVAAARSEPLPVRAIDSGEGVQVDFGAYANSRFDRNPFDPHQYPLVAYRLPDQLRWGTVPFEVSAPPAGHHTKSSIATTCGLPFDTFTVFLEPADTRALHFALGAAGAGQLGRPVVVLTVSSADGTSISRTLYAELDVWDLLKTPPTHAVIHNESTSITGFTLPLNPPFRPIAVTLSSPFSPEPIWPCVSVFALTQELASAGPDGSSYVPINLGPIANADHTRNAFRAATRHNFFPHLQSGAGRFDGFPFLLLDHRFTPSGQSTLTNAGQTNFRLRVPLSATPSSGLALLLSAWIPGDVEGELAEVEVEYDRGAATRSVVVAGRDVNGYPRDNLTDASLSVFTMVLDPKRTPRYMWLRKPSNQPSIDAGVAIFAVTQLPAVTPPVGGISTDR